jgi:hypothetical protein
MNITPETPCLNCVIKLEEDLESCDIGGIIAPAPHAIAAIQATEAIKILTGQEYAKDLLYYHIWKNEIIKIKVNKSDNCQSCNGNYKYLDKKELKGTVVNNSCMQIKPCKTKGALEVIPEKNIQLKLNKLKSKYVIIAELPILTMLKFQNSEVTCYKNGKLIIRKCDSIKDAERIAKKIYEDAK